MDPHSLGWAAVRPGGQPAQGRTASRVRVGVPYRRRRQGSADLAAGNDTIRDPQARLDEAGGLAGAIDLVGVEALIAPRSEIRPATYLGKGKGEEILGLIMAHEGELVVMDCALSPIQQRNLEKEWNVKVLDRTGLILEIIGRRAKPKEGSLQVELAHLIYQRSRLVRSWTHLERQRGGFGFMGGPGETQIEADRRMIGERITRIENDLKKVQATRRLHRAGRQRVPYRVVALVGYTNAGKSTLFNRLTRAEVQAADMLFATLDPPLRALKLPHGGKAMISDTVVRQLNVDTNSGQRRIEVGNKIDRFSPEERENLARIAARRPPERPSFLVSAETGEGIDALLAAIEERLAATRITLDLRIDATDGAGISWIHRNAEVLDKHLDENHFDMVIRVDETKRDIAIARFGAVRREQDN